MDEIKYGKLTLSLVDGAYNVIDCEKDAEVVVIPSSIDGIFVKSIGESAFKDCKALKSVTLPDYSSRFANDEEYIIQKAFADLEEELPRIEDYAFWGCTSLSEITIPECFSSIGWSAFNGCTALAKVVMHGDPFLYSCVFSGCVSLKEITPCSTISQGLFSGCNSLTHLPLKENATTIEEDAFENCDGLIDIVIPKNITRIESLAFRGCANLKSVTFEKPLGWVSYCSYNGKEYKLDLSSPQKNAKMLSCMDFDDGVLYWERKK